MNALFNEPCYIRTQPFEIEIRPGTRPEGCDNGRKDTLEHIFSLTFLYLLLNVHLILIVFDIIRNPGFRPR
jgi:hypothetical protein